MYLTHSYTHLFFFVEPGLTNEPLFTKTTQGGFAMHEFDASHAWHMVVFVACSGVLARACVMASLLWSRCFGHRPSRALVFVGCVCVCALSSACEIGVWPVYATKSPVLCKWMKHTGVGRLVA